MFEGTLFSRITCLHCKHEISFFEKFGELSLNISKDTSFSRLWWRSTKVKIDDMISNYFEEETIDDFKCESCQNTGITKKLNIIKFPKYLIILIKRFVFFPKPRKLLNWIDFSQTTLDLGDNYCDFAEETSREGMSYFEK